LCGDALPLALHLHEDIVGRALGTVYDGKPGHAVTADDGHVDLSALSTNGRDDRGDAALGKVHFPDRPVGRLQVLPEFERYRLKVRLKEREI
jgi:hypothetical protein